MQKTRNENKASSTEMKSTAEFVAKYLPKGHKLKLKRNPDILGENCASKSLDDLDNIIHLD